MRRRDLISVGRSHAHQNLVTNTEFGLFFESLILLYLTVSALFLDRGTDFSKCTLQPRKHITHFIMFIFWPSLFLRLLIYIKYRNVSYAAMQNSIYFLNAYWNVAYGIWTFYNISLITGASHPPKCTDAGRGLLELTYEMLIIFGVFPALITAFFALVGLFCSPYMIYFYC